MEIANPKNSGVDNFAYIDNMACIDDAAQINLSLVDAADDFAAGSGVGSANGTSSMASANRNSVRINLNGVSVVSQKKSLRSDRRWCDRKWLAAKVAVAALAVLASVALISVYFGRLTNEDMPASAEPTAIRQEGN